jgi:enoyl-CoA hydratase/carnithine racemase
VHSTISEPGTAGWGFGADARNDLGFRWCRAGVDDDCMTAPPWPADLLARAGLPIGETAAWAAGAPAPGGRDGWPAAADSVSRFLTRGLALRERLPARGHGTPGEQAARDAIGSVLHEARDSFLRAYTADLYDLLTSGRTRPLRVAGLLAGAAARVPGLVPDAAGLAAERARALPDKDGIELAQGLLVAHVLAQPGPGRHLIGAMLRPLPEALDRLPGLRAAGVADLGPVRLTRQGRAGLLELRNPRHLNAEDDLTLGPTECAVDLILLDPDIEVGVIRGGVVDHPRYPGVRVFGSGLNLTRLYQGHLGYLFYLDRDLGYVHKIFRGLIPPAPADGAAPGPVHPLARVTEKLWIAAVERFAVGGACQLLHVVDHVIATRGSRLFLPARKEGIIPGASNLRLPRFVGDRAARQAILSGREWTAGEPDAAMLCDEVVEPDGMDQALAARIAALTSSGLVNAAANRRTLRAGQEPLDVFREYMAAFALEQARCHLSPALVANLEVHWQAATRGG